MIGAFTHLLMHIRVVSSFCLLWIVLLRTFIYKCLYENMFSFVLGLYLRVKLMGHMCMRHLY